jgi:hypothetical protein
MKGIFKKTTAVTLTLALTMASVCGGVRIQGVTHEVKEAQTAETGGKYIRDLKIWLKSTEPFSQIGQCPFPAGFLRQ